jgi:hypothetical protein
MLSASSVSATSWTVEWSGSMSASTTAGYVESGDIGKHVESGVDVIRYWFRHRLFRNSFPYRQCGYRTEKAGRQCSPPSDR